MATPNTRSLRPARALAVLALLSPAACGSTGEDASHSNRGAGGSSSAIGSGGAVGGGQPTGGADSAGTGGQPSGGASGTGAAAGSAPAECYAPCLWELIAPCRPPGECTRENVDGGRIHCSPDSDWRMVDEFGGQRTVYGPDGSLCYTTQAGASTATAISDEYRDASGNLVATVDQSFDGTSVLTTCASGTPMVSTHPFADECEPWAPRECIYGDCP